MGKLSDWRGELEKIGALAAAMEALAESLHLPEGFEVRYQWPGLDWVEFGHNHSGNSMPRFRAMVAATAAVLGPPSSVKAEHVVGGVEDAPDLRAEWKVPFERSAKPWLRHLDVSVRVLLPAGCKLDPRIEPIAAVSARLHPECMAILADIEDEAAAKAVSK